jgi:hypothetical protein
MFLCLSLPNRQFGPRAVKLSGNCRQRKERVTDISLTFNYHGNET